MRVALSGGLLIMSECPQHGGAFDCTPFCPECQGNQEIGDK